MCNRMNMKDALLLKQAAKNRGVTYQYAPTGTLYLDGKAFTEQRDAEAYLQELPRTDTGHP